MTLTEQWKKGELEEREYWVKIYRPMLKKCEISKLSFVSSRFIFPQRPDDDDFISEVLAPVPCYEEWQQLHKFLEEFNALEVAKENKKLKELLLKCLDKLKSLNCGYDVWGGELTDFIEEIDNAIGEKK